MPVVINGTTGITTPDVDSTADGSFNGVTVGKGAGSGTGNVVIGASAGSALTTGSKNTILGSFSGNQNELNISTASNYIVQSDGDGNPRRYIDDLGRNIERLGSTSGYQYRMRHWAVAQVALANTTLDLCTITSGGVNNAVMVKVRVFQLGYLGTAGASGNEHIGLAWVWSSGSAYTAFVNTMTLTSNISNTNVGTLSWLSNGARNSTLQYTTNRASNYDSFYVEIEMTQNVGGGFTFATPS
jgi:hypothetical protein